VPEMPENMPGLGPQGYRSPPHGYPPGGSYSPEMQPLPRINPPRAPNPRWHEEDVPDFMWDFEERGRTYKPWELKSQKQMDLEADMRKRQDNLEKGEELLRRLFKGKSGQWET
jgi:hypothetical protein